MTFKKSKDKPRFQFFKSLKFRIMLILFLIGIVPSIVVSILVVESYENRAISLRSMNVKNQVDMLSNSLVLNFGDEGADSAVLDSELSMLSNIYNGRLLIVDESFHIVKDTYDLDVGKTSMSKEVITCFQEKSGDTYYDPDNGYIEVVSPIIGTGSTQVKGVLVASVSTNEIIQTVHHLESQSIFVTSIVVLVTLVFGYFFANILVKPFKRVTRAIEDVTDGYETEAISVPDYVETEQITDAFNRMLSRVRQMDNSRQEFVSNVSHELKTPLTSMKVLADSLNGMQDVPVELYQEFMHDIANEIDRENIIIQDLLTMVKVNGKSASLNLEKVEIGGMLESVIKRLKPIAGQRNIEIIMDAYKPVTAEVDQTKLSLAFSNLIENGIKYNIDSGWVRVSLRSDHKNFYVDVSDCGLGISEEQLEHVFERFYRGDKSHSTTIEGTGLGLAITENAIKMHRGSITVNSRVKEGTTFTVKIPFNRDAK